jgi:drug/metabolite transporter (DMT)-like permease
MALGVALAVLAAACYECGYVLQAAEAKVVSPDLALRPALLVRLGARRHWLAGTLLSLAGAALQIAALALAPVTVVQPVLALGIVGLLALARVRLGERVSSAGAAGALALIVGVALVGVASPERSGHVTSLPALVALVALLMAVTTVPFVLRGTGLALAAAAGGDALAAVALKLTADALSNGKPAAALIGALGAALAGLLALTAEMSALRELPATRVAPVVLGAQVIVPAIVAMAALGESASPLLVAGIAAAGGGAALLGSSAGVAGLRDGGLPADAEALAHHARGGRQPAKPAPR